MSIVCCLQTENVRSTMQDRLVEHAASVGVSSYGSEPTIEWNVVDHIPFNCGITLDMQGLFRGCLTALKSTTLYQ